MSRLSSVALAVSLLAAPALAQPSSPHGQKPTAPPNPEPSPKSPGARENDAAPPTKKQEPRPPSDAGAPQASAAQPSAPADRTLPTPPSETTPEETAPSAADAAATDSAATATDADGETAGGAVTERDQAPTAAPPSANDAAEGNPAPSPPSPSTTGPKTEDESEPGSVELTEEAQYGANDEGLVPAKDPPPKMSFDVMLDLTVPLAETAEFIGRPGLQGFAVSFRYYVTERWAVGAGAAFDGLSKKEDGTTTYDGITLSAIHTRQLSFTPLLAKVFYAFRGESKLEPYLALGVGAALSNQRLVTGYSALSENHWHLAAAPEAGVHFDIGQLVLLGAARLTYLPPSGGSVAHTFANVSLGVAIQ